MFVASYNKLIIKRMIAEHDRTASSYKNWVDPSRTHLNYNVGPEDLDYDKATVYRRAINRAKEILGKDRFKKMQKQTNLMSEWTLTYPAKLCDTVEYDTGEVDENGESIIRSYHKPQNPEHCKHFFEVAFKMLAERYGVDNFLGAYVHLDETTPHMHFCFVPEAISRKSGKRTVSSASLLTRYELSGKGGRLINGIHYDMAVVMISTFGEEASDWIMNGRTKGNYTIGELKERDKQQKALEEREQKIKAQEEAWEKNKEEYKTLMTRKNKMHMKYIQQKYDAQRKAELSKLLKDAGVTIKNLLEYKDNLISSDEALDNEEVEAVDSINTIDTLLEVLDGYTDDVD